MKSPSDHDALASLLTSPEARKRAAGRLNATGLAEVFGDWLKAEIQREKFDPLDLIFASNSTCAALAATAIRVFAKKPRGEREREEMIEIFASAFLIHFKEHLAKVMENMDE